MNINNLDATINKRVSSADIIDVAKIQLAVILGVFFLLLIF